MYQVATNYKHIQSSAALTWNIVHGLKTYPIVDVYSVINGTIERVMPKSVLYVDQDTCTLEFDTAINGFAIIV